MSHLIIEDLMNQDNEIFLTLFYGKKGKEKNLKSTQTHTICIVKCSCSLFVVVYIIKTYYCQ